MLMIRMFAAAVDVITMKNVAAATAAVVTSAASTDVVVVISEVVVGKLAISSSATMLKTSPRVVLRSCLSMTNDDNDLLYDKMISLTTDASCRALLRTPF